MHSHLAPDILLPGVSPRVLLKFKKKKCSRIFNGNILEITWRPMHKRCGSHPHNEVPCSRRKNKKDLHQHNQVRRSLKQQGVE